jgi:hypothetical protein
MSHSTHNGKYENSPSARVESEICWRRVLEVQFYDRNDASRGTRVPHGITAPGIVFVVVSDC